MQALVERIIFCFERMESALEIEVLRKISLGLSCVGRFIREEIEPSTGRIGVGLIYRAIISYSVT